MKKIEFIEKMSALSHSKRWNIDSYDEIVVEMSEKYSEDELEMIVNLLEKFEKIPFEAYQNRLENVLKQIPQSILNGIKKIYYLPLLAPADIEKSKSGHVICYLLGALPSSICDRIFKNIKLIKTNIHQLPIEKINRSPYLVLLLDDFIGSGETALSCIDDLIEKKLQKNKILVVSFCSSIVGYDKIKKMNVDVISGIIQDKGISSISDTEQRLAYTNMMTEIENSIDIKENDKFGYGRCECLVSMLNTPNNTFPLFWERNKKNKPLFERKK